MAPIDRRLRLCAWVVRRTASVESMSEARVIATQTRRVPDNALTTAIFGAAAPGTETQDRVIPGLAGDLPVRVYRARRPGGGPGP